MSQATRPSRAKALPTQQRFSDIYRLNDRLNQIILEQLPREAWRAPTPGMRARTIADIFAHMHNVRRKWIRLSAPHLKLPPPLNRNNCTPKQSGAALAVSAECCAEMLDQAACGELAHFHRDGWAKPWPPGAAMLAYMLTHEAHHRGQICMLAHQLGHKLPTQATSAMWNWEKLWRAMSIDTHA